MIQTVRTLLISITATKAVMILLIITLVMPTALQNLTIIPEAIMQRTPAASTSPTAWVVPINTAQTLHTSIIAAMIAMILLITMPTWINMLVRTYAWMGILQDNGVLNTILGFFGIGPVEMLHTSFAVILGMVYNFIPFMILQIHTSLDKMDKNLLNAAADLGASKVQTFLRVTLPLSLPGVISGITLVFLPAVSSFFIPKLLGGGQYVLVGNIIETQFLTAGDWNFGSAISLIMAIIIMFSMWLTNKVDVQPASSGKE